MIRIILAVLIFFLGMNVAIGPIMEGGFNRHDIKEPTLIRMNLFFLTIIGTVALTFWCLYPLMVR